MVTQKSLTMDDLEGCYALYYSSYAVLWLNGTSYIGGSAIVPLHEAYEFLGLAYSLGSQ